MKLANTILLSAAVFVGAFGALYAFRTLERREVTTIRVPIVSGGALLPAQAPGGAGAPDFRAAARQLERSVVSIDRLQRFSSFRFDEDRLAQTGSGSGVIVTAQGHIVTNNHVIEGADALIVRLSDGRSAPAEIVGADPQTDLAVLRITLPNLQPAQLGDSSQIEIGQWVLAVGNPLGFDNTVSAGVVSAVNRQLGTPGRGMLVDAIQTDAAINQGNSGGALADAQGRVIGINTMIASTTGGSIGIGFAIPSNRVKRVVEELVQYGRVRYGFLGADTFTQAGILADPQFRAWLGSQIGVEPPPMDTGLVIRGIRRGGGAANAGMLPGDVLLEIEGRKLNHMGDLLSVLLDKRAGDAVRVRFWSRGETKTANVRLTER
ncbi:MAG: trypsin-like peptidase domain-containing protein [Fimbriimonadaceae bacterium]